MAFGLDLGGIDIGLDIAQYNYLTGVGFGGITKRDRPDAVVFNPILLRITGIRTFQ